MVERGWAFPSVLSNANLNALWDCQKSTCVSYKCKKLVNIDCLIATEGILQLTPA